jgi:hypothetical protein
MKHLGSLVLCASLLTACGGSSSMSSAPTADPPPGPTPTPILATDCPTASPLTVVAFVEADPACFGDRDVTIRGWFAPPPAMGWEPPFNVKPWRWPEPPGVLWQRGPGGEAMCGGGDDCGWLAVNVLPDSGLEFGDVPAWIVVTGHLNDPAAAACRWDPTGVDALPPVELAREECLGDFVLTAIAPAP